MSRIFEHSDDDEPSPWDIRNRREPTETKTANSNFEVRSTYEADASGNVLPRSMGGGSGRAATCRTCGQPATPLHNGDMCKQCWDWNGCGTDCTLSGWTCEPCGITEDSAPS